MKLSRCLLVAILSVGVLYVDAAKTLKTCYFDESARQYFIKDGQHFNGIAWGFYSDTIENLGYGELHITTNAKFDDRLQMFCAGYLEGALTASRIFDLWRNFYESTFKASGVDPRLEARLFGFAQATLQWTRDQIDVTGPGSEHNFYWKQVDMVIIQLDGLVGGYNAFRPPGARPLSDSDLFLLNSLGDTDDLIPAMNRQLQIEDHGRASVPDMATSPDDAYRAAINSHCSAIVKPVGGPSGFTDIYIAHEMWSSYYQLLNVYKHYTFNLQAQGVPGKCVSFSSYPGLLSSEDDFYITSANLVVMETTNDVYNTTLYDLLTPQSLMSWIRVIVSNRVAAQGKEWHDLMRRYNSGTYNNQWMVVDLKKFTPGSTVLATGLLVIGEQYPGYYKIQDVTPVMAKQTYWPSYNVPYFPSSFELGGYPAMVSKYGNVYTYDMCPRAQIFKQQESNVKDLASLQKVMRYNNFQNDPLSLKCAAWSLASRYDLATQLSNGLCRPAAFGAINAKATSYSMGMLMRASIVGGPTHDQQPVFTWTQAVSDRFNDTKHYGQPTTFNFDWMEVQPN